MVGNCGSGAACFAHHGWRTHLVFHSTNCKMVFQCAPMFSACVVHCGCFCPFVRRTAVQISVCEELQDVRCGIAFFCAQTSMARCKATVGFDKRGRSTCCFASIARETRPGFLGLLRTLPDVHFSHSSNHCETLSWRNLLAQ